MINADISYFTRDLCRIPRDIIPLSQKYWSRIGPYRDTANVHLACFNLDTSCTCATNIPQIFNIKGCHLKVPSCLFIAVFAIRFNTTCLQTAHSHTPVHNCTNRRVDGIVEIHSLCKYHRINRILAKHQA